MYYYCYSCDGGVSNNDFVMQLISDLTQKSIIRMPSPDMSAIGVALMAGIEQGTTTILSRRIIND